MRLISCDLDYSCPTDLELWLRSEKADVYCFQQASRKAWPLIDDSRSTFSPMRRHGGFDTGLLTTITGESELLAANARQEPTKWYQLAARGGMQWSKIRVSATHELWIVNLYARGMNTLKFLADMQALFRDTPLPILVIGEVAQVSWNMARDGTIGFLKDCGLTHHGLSTFSRGVEIVSMDVVNFGENQLRSLEIDVH